jgi:large subunit ribosomal protein L30e
METTTKLPDQKGLIGAREIAKAFKAGKIKKVVVANNCPEELIKKLEGERVYMEMFSGNQKELGTKLGKPFPVAMVGYE